MKTSERLIGAVLLGLTLAAAATSFAAELQPGMQSPPRVANVQSED